MSWNRKYVHKNFHKKSMRNKLIIKKICKSINMDFSKFSLGGGTIRIYAGAPPHNMEDVISNKMLMEFEL